MSRVHANLSQSSTEGRTAATAAQAEKGVVPAPLAEIQRKERRLAEGIRELETTIADLRKRLDDAERALAAQQAENERLLSRLSPQASSAQGTYPSSLVSEAMQ